MKRLFILLGVILLSFILTSCKEDSKYKEYERSKELNEKILSEYITGIKKWNDVYFYY